MHKRKTYRKTKTNRRPSDRVKHVIIVVRVVGGLAQAIDEDAERAGLSRSAVVRRTLLDAFRDRIAS